MISLTPELLVDNLPETLTWYKSVLGFEVVITSPESTNPTFARIQRGNVEIMLFHRTEFAHEIPSFTTQPMGGSFVLYLEVSEIDSFWGKIKDQVKVVQPLHTTDYDSTEFTIQDCNGYYLMFGQKNQ